MVWFRGKGVAARMASGRPEEEVMVAGIQAVECRRTKAAMFRASGSHTHGLAWGRGKKGVEDGFGA